MAASGNLKILGIAGRTDSAGAAITDIDQEELRLPTGSLLRPGLLCNLLDQTPNPNGYRVRQNTGADMNLKVGSAVVGGKVDGYVIRGLVAGQGSYIARLDAATKTIAVPASDGALPTRYGVYLILDDIAYSGDASRAYGDVVCIRGTPNASPVTPVALATWSAYALLWEFQLAAAASAVTDAILDSATGFDRRVSADLAEQPNPLEVQVFS